MVYPARTALCDTFHWAAFLRSQLQGAVLRKRQLQGTFVYVT